MSKGSQVRLREEDLVAKLDGLNEEAEFPALFSVHHFRTPNPQKVENISDTFQNVRLFFFFSFRNMMGP